MNVDERESKPTESKSPPSFNQSRRSFAKASSIVPVLLSFANRPAFGAICTPSGYASAKPNGGVNPSGTRHVVGGCGGLSPGAWATPYDGAGTWPTGYSPGGPTQALNPEKEGQRDNDLYEFVSGVWRLKSNHSKTFSGMNPPATFVKDAFGHPGLFADETLYDVLWLGAQGDPYQLGAHLIAALLNANMQIGTPGVMTVADVIDMYTQLSSNGFYRPGQNGKWDSWFDLDGSGSQSDYDWTAEEVVAFIQQTFH